MRKKGHLVPNSGVNMKEQKGRSRDSPSEKLKQRIHQLQVNACLHCGDADWWSIPFNQTEQQNLKFISLCNVRQCCKSVWVRNASGVHHNVSWSWVNKTKFETASSEFTAHWQHEPKNAILDPNDLDQSDVHPSFVCHCAICDEKEEMKHLLCQDWTPSGEKPWESFTTQGLSQNISCCDKHHWWHSENQHSDCICCIQVQCLLIMVARTLACCNLSFLHAQHMVELDNQCPLAHWTDAKTMLESCGRMLSPFINQRFDTDEWIGHFAAHNRASSDIVFVHTARLQLTAGHAAAVWLRS